MRQKECEIGAAVVAAGIPGVGFVKEMFEDYVLIEYGGVIAFADEYALVKYDGFTYTTTYANLSHARYEIRYPAQ